MIDHDYNAHSNERDKAVWNSLKPAPLTEADFLGTLTSRHSACNCVLCEMDRLGGAPSMKSIFTEQYCLEGPQYTVTRQINQSIKDGTYKAEDVVSIVHDGDTVTVYYRAGS
jgi:hypothetical protein